MRIKLHLTAIAAFFCFNAFSQTTAYPVPDLFQCDSGYFDLTVQTPIVLGNQNPADYTVTYYQFINGEELIIETPASYEPYYNEPVYIRVTSSEDSTSDVTSFQVTAFMVPDFENQELCIEYTLPMLYSNEMNYYTEAGGTGTLLHAGDIIYGSQTVYIYGQHNGCTSESSFDIAIKAPYYYYDLSLNTVCDDNADGLNVFDLSMILDAMVGDQTGFVSSFHFDVNEASANINPIVNIAAFANTVPWEQIIYVRHEILNCTWVYGVRLNVVNCTNNSIEGTLAFDFDNNGCTPNDYPASNVQVQYENNGTTYFTHTDDAGQYKFLNVPDGQNVLNAVSIPNFSTAQGPYTFTMPGNEVADFCYTSSQSVNDVSVFVAPMSQSRPGFPVIYALVYQNHGTAIANGTVTLQFDDNKINFVNATPAMSQSGNTLSLSYSNLLPFQTVTVYINFMVEQPPVANGEEILVFNASIDPVNGDANPADNTAIWEEVIVNSYDPNDIQVREGESITEDQADEYLHYLVRFQNTGNADAININIKSNLDANLDWSTFQPIASSHDYQANRMENRIEFMFNDIHLPALSDDEPGSHGYILYRIKPKAGLTVGDVMSASVRIYFDFNPPVETNWATTTIESNMGVEENSTDAFRIYPNPASDKVILALKNTDETKVKFVDVTGKVILEEMVSGNKSNIDISGLSPGLYFVTISVDGKQQSEKLVIK